MRGRWNLSGFRMHEVLCAVLMLHLLADECLSLNLEGLALLKFRSKVHADPHGVFLNWDPRDADPCNWTGVHCVVGQVVMLNLKELTLGGILSPELGNLSHLQALVLSKNNFSGVIPKEIGRLTMLELLDLRSNSLSGKIPMEIGEMHSLKELLLCGNKFQGSTPWIMKPNMQSDLRYGKNHSCVVAADISHLNRKVKNCIWQNGLQNLKKVNSFLMPLRAKILKIFDMKPLFKGDSTRLEERYGVNLPAGFCEPFFMPNVYASTIRRRLLEESSNLPATPVSGAPPQEVVTVPSTGSGSFPAVPRKNKPSPAPILPADPRHAPESMPTNLVETKPTSSKSSAIRVYFIVIPIAALLLIIAAAMLFTCRSKGVATIGPWKTGLSGQLQKAFVTGVPKLNRQELEAACEDFSNIINTFPDFVVFKGTLSSGVEIAVVSSSVPSGKEWSKRCESHFRKKIDTLSRINHKNFINLLGYCEEEEPFMRMMVFEYAPNGTLYEHLHLEEFEQLDWSARTRLIMGMAYCLQHMHELSPPISHPDVQSKCILLSDDYAAKLADVSVWREVARKGKISGDDSSDHSESPPADLASNVYSFGLLLLEIISGKVPYSEEHGSLANLASEYLNNNQSICQMVDPMLKSHKDDELDVICEVIKDCIHPDPKQRPAMREVTSKLKGVLAISPEQATPRLSPLWWAELEILSVEAS